MGRAAIALVVGLAIGGCASEPDGATACTANIAFGIWVHVTDSASGAPLSGATGQVRSGAYVDTLRDDGAGDGVYVGAPEQRGTFSMHLERAGYTSIDMSQIVVSGADCHVDPTVLHVPLAAQR
jgi:hypothetical protein